MNNWFKICLQSNSTTKEAVLNFLFENECVGCEEHSGEIVAYFQDSVDEIKLQRRTMKFLVSLEQMELLQAQPPILSKVPAQDWNVEWKKHFKPVVVSRHFTVKPSWEVLAKPATDFVIEIDPKQAFGTGGHATTALMLQLLETEPVAEKSILDVGTGTGILAIAAQLLGAAHVTAIDNDPIAIEAADENVRQNLTSVKTITLLTGEPEQVSLPAKHYDMILANLTRKVILRYLSRFVVLLADSAALLLSGILIEELLSLRKHLTANGQLEISREVYRDEWVAVVLRRRR